METIEREIAEIVRLMRRTKPADYAGPNPSGEVRSHLPAADEMDQQQGPLTPDEPTFGSSVTKTLRQQLLTGLV